MPCRTFDSEGVHGIICGPRRQQRKCRAPDCFRFVVFLCDYPTGPGKTCNLGFCKHPKHGREVGPNVHHCWRHIKQPAAAQEALL